MKIVAWILCIIWLALYLKHLFFLQKALWKLTSAKSVLLRGNGCRYLLPVHMESPSGPKSTSFFSQRSLKWQSILFVRISFLVYKGRNDVTISQTWEFLIGVYLCLFVCSFAVKLAFVPSLLPIMFTVKVWCQFHPLSFSVLQWKLYHICKGS